MQAVRDPLWKHIFLPDALYEATNTKDFLRLHGIKQLGPSYLVYPGATHTRAAHSFGVYEVASRLIKNLIQKGARNWVSREGMQSFLAASLFHDLGHFPYTHSLKELPLLDHEVLTGEIILTEPLRSIIGKTGANPEQVAAIVDTSKDCSDVETLFYRKLLSGVLDPDKLDYLNRDAFYCGVPYGIQDTEFVLAKLIPHKERGIIIDSSAMLSCENVLFSKYLMYKAVYWHKNVRIATAMMKKTLYTALKEGILEAKELYSIDDQGLYSLLESKTYFDELECADAVQNKAFFKVLYECPYNESYKLHRDLEDLEKREKIEKKIAKKIGCKAAQILIDVPERISFESDLYIRDEKTSFSKSSTVFSEHTVERFTTSLRKIRLAVSPLFLSHKTDKETEKNIKLIEEFFFLDYNT